ncbi:MAG: 30S ribosomal protein S9 [Candidatus Falkowbacteria bacterium]
MTTQQTTNKTKVEEPVVLKGKHTSVVSRRKTAVARLRIYKKGTGIFIVNGRKLSDYFSQDKINTIKQPLKLTGNLKAFNFSIVVKGGGGVGQAEAIRHGIAKALVEMDETIKPVIKPKGWLTRDSRKKERKKPGLRRARRSPQWSKR